MTTPARGFLAQLTPGNTLVLLSLALAAASVVCGTYNSKHCPKDAAVATGLVGLALATA